MTAPAQSAMRGLPDQRLLAQGAGGRARPADGAWLGDRRARLRRHASRGRSTTGWASPRRRSSRSRATWRATSGRRGSGSIWSQPARSGRSPRAGSRGSSSSPSCGAAQAPLGWDIEDPVPVARAICWLLSDYSQAISGEIVHVDGGFHADRRAEQPRRLASDQRLLRYRFERRADEHSLQPARRVEVVAGPDHAHAGRGGVAVGVAEIVRDRLDEPPVGAVVAPAADRARCRCR